MCFTCHREGSTACKRKDETFKINNAEYGNAAFSGSEL